MSEPEEFENYEYAAQEFPDANKVRRQYASKLWATPISGDATTRWKDENESTQHTRGNQ